MPPKSRALLSKLASVLSKSKSNLSAESRQADESVAALLDPPMVAVAPCAELLQGNHPGLVEAADVADVAKSFVSICAVLAASDCAVGDAGIVAWSWGCVDALEYRLGGVLGSLSSAPGRSSVPLFSLAFLLSRARHVFLEKACK
jgi:hypothetical protein